MSGGAYCAHQRVTLAQKLSVACPKCGERAGMFCRRTLLDGGDCIADRCHSKRREAYLREQAEAAELAAYRAQQLGDVRVTFPFPACPCESDLDDPGPHIPTCPWADPDYTGDET